MLIVPGAEHLFHHRKHYALRRTWDYLKGELEADPPVHLTVARGTRRVRRAGLMDHRRPLAPEFVTLVHGLRVTTVDRTWLDLCSLTPPWTFEDLVAAGDHAVRHPWTPAGRTDPATTIAALRSALHASGRFHGRPAARIVPEADNKAAETRKVIDRIAAFR